MLKDSKEKEKILKDFKDKKHITQKDQEDYIIIIVYMIILVYFTYSYV